MPTYNQLVQYFKNQGNPGANGAAPHTNEWNDAYNNYYGTLAQQQGADSFESIDLNAAAVGPTTTIPNIQTQGPTDAPAAYTPPPTTSTAPVPHAPVANISAPNPSVPGVSVTAPPPQILEAPMPTNQGNYNQTQNSVQAGQFGTVGTTSNDSKQSTTQTTQGTQTVRPDDVYGFGQLLRDQAAATQSSDAARTTWLTDIMNTGGTAFQQQLDAGIRQSLSGPGMIGIGDEGRGRTAGAAAADIGRSNLNQRLGASQQLATGPASGLSALAAAAQPYGVGQTTSTSGTTTGLSELITRASEAQAGTTSAQSSQAGAGLIPQGQPVKTGGCVLCTAAIELKLSKHHRVLRKVIKHKLVTDAKRFHPAAKGYFAVFTPLADWLLTHPRIARTLWPVAKAVVYEELRVAGRQLPFRLWAWLVHWTGHTFCSVVGNTFNVKGYVDNQRILDIAQRNNIFFKLEEI